MNRHAPMSLQSEAEAILGDHALLLKHATAPVSALDESIIDTQRHLDMLQYQLQDMLRRLEAERAHIALTLAAFYRAPLSMSSVQPVLTLAETLNPELRGR